MGCEYVKMVAGVADLRGLQWKLEEPRRPLGWGVSHILTNCSPYDDDPRCETLGCHQTKGFSIHGLRSAPLQRLQRATRHREEVGLFWRLS